MNDETSKKNGMPWWGWVIVAVLGIALLSSLIGRDEERIPVEPTVEEQIDQEESMATDSNAANASDQSSSEYDPCSTNGNLFVIRAEENCVEPWPLDSASGILYCNPFGELNDSVVYQPDEDPSMYYALNGSALASGYPDIDPIWLDDPEGSSPKMDLGELIDAALELCG